MKALFRFIDRIVSSLARRKVERDERPKAP